MQKKLDQLDEEEETRKKDLENLIRKMGQIQSKLDNPPSFPESLEQIEADRDRIRQEFDSIREAQHEVGLAMQSLAREENNAKTLVSNAQQRYVSCLTSVMATNANPPSLRDLTQVTGRRMQNLQRWDIASYTVADWLQKNQSKFRMEVFLPPCISVSVPDRNYQAAVEACFSASQMRVIPNYYLLETWNSSFISDFCRPVPRRLSNIKRIDQFRRRYHES
jgi:structural maintenance of chromosomes protein 5